MSSETFLRLILRAGLEDVVILLFRKLWQALQQLTEETDTDLDDRLFDIIRSAVHECDADKKLDK